MDDTSKAGLPGACADEVPVVLPRNDSTQIDQNRRVLSITFSVRHN